MPQSLLKVYGFIEDWRAEQGKRYTFLFQNLLDEWEEQRLASNSSATVQKLVAPNFDLKLQFLLRHLALQSDLLPSLSLQYSAHDLFMIVHQPLSRDGPTLKYTFQLAKQDLHFNTRAQPHKPSTDDPSTGSFAIPAIRCTGSIQVEDRPRTAHVGLGSISEMTHIAQVSKLHSNISMDVVSLSLNVSMIDQLLTAQSLVGNEISDLVDVFSYFKHQSRAAIEEPPSTDVSLRATSLKPRMLFSVDFSLRGLAVAAASPAALGLFESSILRAYVSNDTSSKSMPETLLIWKVMAHSFTLSLEHNVVSNKAQLNDRRYKRNRLAYISTDFTVQNYANGASSNAIDANVDGDNDLKSFFVDISKTQVVMQPIALGKLTDLYLYYQRELARKEEMKKSEIDKLAVNTKRIMSSLKVELPQPQEASRSMWEGKLISITVSNFGVAVPLDSTENVPNGPQSRDVKHFFSLFHPCGSYRENRK